MFRSPPVTMVNTRSSYKKTEQLKNVDDEPATTSKVAHSDIKSESVYLETGSAAVPKKTATAPASLQGSAPAPSTSSSLEARKKRLELEAAEAKARIKMELIDKKLAADMADLEEEYSPLSEKNSISKVEKWLERSQQELKHEPCTRDGGPRMGAQCPPAARAAGEEGTVQMLANALRDLATTSANTQNATLLSRLSTPRDLPVFSGDPMEWLQFKQTYEESTEVCNFSDKENLWRLRKCLQGAAKEAVSALLISAVSPNIIMSTLALQFGNPDIILSQILLEIKKLQPMSQEYYTEIIPFSIKIKNFVAAVHAVGRDEYLQGVQVVSTILSKLPTVLLSKWADYVHSLDTANPLTKLELLSQFLTNEATKLSASNVSLINVRPYVMKHKCRGENVLQLHSDPQINNENDICRYCRASKHALPDCKQFKKALRKDKWRYVKQNGICYKCLVSRHERETCPAPACDKDDCRMNHHRLLHYSISSGNTRSDNCIPDVGVNQAAVTPPSLEVVTHVSVSDCKVLLKVVPLNVHGPNGVISTTALLDDGSTVTLISANLAERVGLRGRCESMRVSGPWSGDRLECNAQIVKLNVSNRDGDMFSFNARSVSKLSLPKQDLSLVNCESYNHLHKIKNQFCCSLEKPEILIGQDNYDLLLSRELIIGKPNEPCASLTALGWCVHGRVPVSASVNQNHSALCLATGTDTAREWDNIHEEIRRSFSIESMGVSPKPRENSEDLLAVARLEQTTTFMEGRWYVGLPWKDPKCKMPNSYPNALLRLKGVERKIRGNAEYGQRYIDRINHLFNNDYAEKISNTIVTPQTWYLPHFGVDNPNKRKLRLVFDAAAQSNGLCLNDYLYKGPDLLASLLGIMLRFREHKIAVTGDIKDMFLRIKMLAEDRNAFRFLWRDDPSKPVSEYVMSSLIFGANCSPFIAQYIKNKNANRFISTMPSAVSAICTQHYMDDYIDSVADEETAIQLVRDISYIHKEGGFHMCNWTSNCTKLLNSIPTESIKETIGSTSVRFKIGEQYEGERTLGLLWFPDEDTLSFDVSFKRIPKQLTSGEQKPTKRQMLRIIMSIFDVFGFLSPITINGKVLLQDTWRSALDWDTPITDEIFERWRKWLHVLHNIHKLRIPRFYEAAAALTAGGTEMGIERSASSGSTAPHAPLMNGSSVSGYTNLQLHIFCDASPKAMCAVAYWRWVNDNHIFVAFIASRCRVAPVKHTSVPRLELQAALLAARLADTIKREHKMQPKERFLWSDSSTVLHWIRNNARNYKPFIAHRLGEIDEHTIISEWCYVPTKFNVADLATRESYDDSIVQSEWLTGPKFLRQPETEWPRDSLQLEVKESDLEFVSTIQIKLDTLPVPDCTRFSSWLRLQRATATLLMFINKCRKLTVNNTAAVMENAHRLLIRQAQIESFGEDLVSISGEKSLNKNSKLLALSPFLDSHGVLRADGRIGAAEEISPDTKNPIILDGRHHLTKLIIRDYHVKAAHGNQETVVNEVKQKYWVIKLRPTIKHVASTCMFCRIRKAKPQVPRMGDLPAARLAHHTRPFTHCGIDLFGPYDITVGRRHERRYGVLFTCLTVRAIHVELAHNLTTDSLILALRRMAARRGWPRHIYSDNGTNLRGAETELKRSIQNLNNEVLISMAANYGTVWSFIPPVSPHWGGAWERLIRSVKDALSVILKERAPREEAFNTLLAEVENMVNSRPLTHVSVELGSEVALTPNHFLLGSSANLPVIGEFDDSEFYLRRQWRISQRLADMFWKRWVKEVLPNMIPRQKWQEERESLQVGDFVIVIDPDGPRNVWPRGIVQHLFPGKDGRVRMVEVKTRSGTLKRSVTRVAKIPIVHE